MEENKVATQLKEIVHDAVCCGSSSHKPCEYLADKLLHSPDLRVTLVVHPTPIAEMIDGLRRCALLSPSESVILDILERMNKETHD